MPPKFCPQNFAASSEKFAVAVAMDKLLLQAGSKMSQIKEQHQMRDTADLPTCNITIILSH